MLHYFQAAHGWGRKLRNFIFHGRCTVDADPGFAL